MYVVWVGVCEGVKVSVCGGVLKKLPINITVTVYVQVHVR